jgi:hypothetical protein
MDGVFPKGMTSKHHMKSSSKATRAERRRQAARLLEKSFQHVEHSLDAALEVVRDSNAIATEILENDEYSFKDWLGDALALSIRSCSVVTSCLKHESTEDAPTTAGKRTPNEVVDPGEEDGEGEGDGELEALRLSLLFDIKSEMAGQSVISLPLVPPLKLQNKTDLTSDGNTIDKEHILLRFLDDRVMMSLCDLKDVAAGSYRGTLTIADATDAVDVEIVAECRDRLWWR